ncbi:hypothetical protein HY386_02845 [Candidatus Daviesbacteria bacterium]|nr:hypothetical protein [Candidatus Daviesbacteria bacterium]
MTTERTEGEILVEEYIQDHQKPYYSLTDLAHAIGRKTSSSISKSIPCQERLARAGIHLNYYTPNRFSEEELRRAAFVLGPPKPRKETKQEQTENLEEVEPTLEEIFRRRPHYEDGPPPRSIY